MGFSPGCCGPLRPPSPQGDGHIRVGKLNLVDLAGSERQSKTQATGERAGPRQPPACTQLVLCATHGPYMVAATRAPTRAGAPNGWEAQWELA